jgi:branched-chain amino acid transport system permease protein
MRRLPAFLFFGLVLALPLLPVPAFWYTTADYIGVAVIAVLGLVLLTGMAGMTSFGQAAFVGIGAYTTAVLCTQLQASPWLGLVAGLALSGVSAVVIGAITVRLSGHFLPLATIAWALSLYYLFGTLELLGKYDGIGGIPPITLFGLALDTPQRMLVPIWLVVGLCMLLVRNVLDSRPGRVIRALNGGAAMAESMGANTARYRLAAFVMAALMASVAGWLVAHLQRSINATPFGLNTGIEYLFMAVIGGLSSIWGAVLGAGVLTLLKNALQDWVPALFGAIGNLELVVFGAIIVLALQRSARGLWPLVQRLAPAPRTPQADPPAADLSTLTQRAKPARGEPLLSVEKARKQFGGLVAVNDMTFELRAGELVGLIGPNGAGKSTMFNLITGVLPVTSGQIRFLGQRVDAMAARNIVRQGIGRSFQHVKLMPEMSVLENVAIGAYLRGGAGMLRAALRADRAEEARLYALAAEQIRRVGLQDVMHQSAGSLALGQQRILEIARALCTDPVLLLLDEPAAGLRLQEKNALTALLQQLRGEGMAVLIVEHDMDFVMSLMDRIVVMEFGTRIANGRPQEVRDDPAVLRAYLGGVEFA